MMCLYEGTLTLGGPSVYCLSSMISGNHFRMNFLLTFSQRVCQTSSNPVSTVVQHTSSTGSSDVSYGQILKYFSTLNWSTTAVHGPARILQALVAGKACFWGYLRG